MNKKQKEKREWKIIQEMDKLQKERTDLQRELEQLRKSETQKEIESYVGKYYKLESKDSNGVVYNQIFFYIFEWCVDWDVSGDYQQDDFRTKSCSNFQNEHYTIESNDMISLDAVSEAIEITKEVFEQRLFMIYLLIEKL